MKRATSIGQLVLSVLFILSISLPGIQPAAAQDSGVRISHNPHTGKVSFIGTTPDHPLPIAGAQLQGMAATDRAMSIAQSYAGDFGLREPARELKVTKSESLKGRQVTKYQQVFQDVPVMGGELVVDATDQGGLISMNGEISPDLSIDTHPTVMADQARQTALQSTAKIYQGDAAGFNASQPTLWIYDSRLLEPDGTAPSLVWRMDVTSRGGGKPIRELVLVDAHRGNVVLNFNQDDTGFNAKKLDSLQPFYSGSGRDAGSVTIQSHELTSSSQSISTYTMNHATSGLPGQLVCTLENPGCTNNKNPDADHAQEYALDTYTFYQSHLGRNSVNNAGLPLISSVHYGNNYQNAFWSGTQMVYGDGYSAGLDVVGHELTHGVTQYSSNLFYYYQSGAINESLSDVFGELIQHSYQGTVDNWLIGEDLPIGAIRSMSDPTMYGDPDGITSPYYYTGDLDNGGVHWNSGVNNKAAYLMVSALGEAKTAAIYYEVETHLLTSGSDYADLYDDLYQACLNLVGGPSGIVQSDCQSVRDATDAVYMNQQPVASYNPEAPLCATGNTPVNAFYDGLESGSGNWVFQTFKGTQRWRLNSIYGPFAHAGKNFLYADDYPQAVTDVAVAMKYGVKVPANGFLYFAHAFDFEHYSGISTWYDGGVLEYSTDYGATWKDAGPLILNNGYRGTIFAGYPGYPQYSNPLHGRRAFVGTSHGYISTRLNLGSLAGQTVKFRWRMGLDVVGYSWGWWLDDVRIYNCTSFAKLTPVNGASGRPSSVTLTWQPASGATSYEYCYDTIGDGSCSNWQPAGISVKATVLGLSPSTTYYWQVRANTATGPKDAAGGWWPFTTGPLPSAFSKLTPTPPAISQLQNPILTWETSANATLGYEYCVDTTDNNACDSSWVATTQTSAALSGLELNTTYYWQVRGVNSFGPTEADGGTWLSFTTAPSVYTISGKVAAGGTSLTFTGSTADGPVNGRVFADANGNYALGVPPGWTGTVTPVKAGVTFTPASKTYLPVAADQPLQNYSAIVQSVSVGTQDGWILESGENTNVGSTLNSTDPAIKLGDDAGRRQYRSILSFSTGPALPDTAVITSVNLWIRRQAVVGGGNPISLFQGLLLDMMKGTFGTAVLELNDFQATAATASYRSFGPFLPTAGASGWYSIPLPATAYSYVNKLSAPNGLTQIRLRFKLDDNNDSIANYLSLQCGNAATAANRPILVITYQLP